MLWIDLKDKPALIDGKFTNEDYLHLQIAPKCWFKYDKPWGSFINNMHETIDAEETTTDAEHLGILLAGYTIAETDELKKQIIMCTLELLAFGDLTDDVKGIAGVEIKGVMSDALENAVFSCEDLTNLEIRSYLPLYIDVLTPEQKAEIIASTFLGWYRPDADGYDRSNFSIDRDLLEMMYPNKMTEIDLFFEVLIDKIEAVKGNYHDTIKIFQDFADSKPDSNVVQYALPDLGME